MIVVISTPLSQMPACYLPPLGIPLYWRDEQTGALREAVHAWIDSRVGQGSITPEQLKLVIDYCRYFIEAPCWSGSRTVLVKELQDLREDISRAQTADDLARWIHAALEIGLDPL